MPVITCARCSTTLDPDAPGAACSVCLSEMAGPHRVVRVVGGSARPGRRRQLDNLARVACTATALAEREGRDLTEDDLRTAASLHRSEIKA